MESFRRCDSLVTSTTTLCTSPSTCWSTTILMTSIGPAPQISGFMKKQSASCCRIEIGIGRWDVSICISIQNWQLFRKMLPLIFIETRSSDERFEFYKVLVAFKCKTMVFKELIGSQYQENNLPMFQTERVKILPAKLNFYQKDYLPFLMMLLVPWKWPKI